MSEEWAIPNAGKKWEEGDKIKLVGWHYHHKSYTWMAKQFGRTKYAIEAQIEYISEQNLFNFYKNLFIQQTTLNNIESKENIVMSNNTKVITKTFVGNREAKDLNTDELLNIIEQEEKFIKRLSSLTIQSDKIKKLIARHTKNLNKLMTLLG